MKSIPIILLLAVASGCSPEAQESVPRPVAGEHASTTNENISSELAASWGRQADFFRDGNFTVIGWDAAQELLRKRRCRGGKQYHTGWLTIYTVDDQKYLTKQPKIDAFFEFMKENNLSTQGFGTE